MISKIKDLVLNYLLDEKLNSEDGRVEVIRSVYHKNVVLFYEDLPANIVKETLINCFDGISVDRLQILEKYTGRHTKEIIGNIYEACEKGDRDEHNKRR